MPSNQEKDNALKKSMRDKYHGLSEQRKQEEYLKDKQRELENQQRQEQIKRELRAARGLEHNKEQDKLVSSTGAELDQAIKTLSSVELKTFIEWATAMSEIFTGCRALYNDLTTTGLGFLWTETIGRAWTKTAGRIELVQAAQQVGRELFKTGSDLVKSGASSAVEKADIKVLNETLDYLGIKENFHNQFNCYFKLDVDENGKLVTKGMYKGRVMSDEQNTFLTNGFIQWAKLRGCEYDETTKILKDESGNIMTSEHLQEINTDDENGFTAFVRQAYDVELQDKYKNNLNNSPSSTPVPRPY